MKQCGIRNRPYRDANEMNLRTANIMTFTKTALLTACLLVGGTVTQAQVTIDVASGGAIAETGSSFTFNVSGVSADVSSVKLRLAFSYNFLDDLNITLSSPGGVKSVAVLGAAHGDGDGSAEFRDVVFSDSGSAFPSSASNPLSGTYRTQTGQDLSSGASSFSGLTPAEANDIRGWTLSFIEDVATRDGDSGILYRSGTVPAPWTGFVGTQLEITVVPEPSTYATLFGLGALGLAVIRRFRKA